MGQNPRRQNAVRPRPMRANRGHACDFCARKIRYRAGESTQPMMAAIRRLIPSGIVNRAYLLASPAFFNAAARIG